MRAVLTVSLGLSLPMCLPTRPWWPISTGTRERVSLSHQNAAIVSSALYLVGGLAILLAALLPSALSRVAVSPPMVLLAAGICIGFVPVGGHAFVDPVGEPTTIEQVTQFTVLLAVMGVGLALDRPLR